MLAVEVAALVRVFAPLVHSQSVPGLEPLVAWVVSTTVFSPLKQKDY